MLKREFVPNSLLKGSSRENDWSSLIRNNSWDSQQQMRDVEFESLKKQFNVAYQSCTIVRKTYVF